MLTMLTRHIASWPWEHTDVTITGDLKLEESYWFALQHKMSHKWDFSPRLFFDQHGNAHREEEPNDLQRKILLHMVDKTAPDPLATTKSESSESSETTSSKDGSTATTLFESTQEGEEVPKSTEDSTSKAHTTSVTSATQSEASSSSLRTASAPSRTAEPPSTTRQGAHGSSSSNSLALGAKIGIGVAAGVGGLSTVVLVGMLICRRRRGRNPKEADQAVSHGPSMAAAEKPSSNHLNTPEVASNPIFELAADQVWTGGEGPEGTNTTPHKVVENRWQKRWSRGRSDVS